MEIESSILNYNQNHPIRLDTTFCSYLRHGLCIHHAGLTDYERTIAESLFRRGNIRLLAATSTLSAGVNLNVDVVIIDGLSRCKVSYSSTEYKQMIGRTGRMGQSKQGKVFVLVDRNEEPFLHTIRNSMNPTQHANQNRYLRNEEYWEKAIIELIAGGYDSMPNQIIWKLYSNSFFSTFVPYIPYQQFIRIQCDTLKSTFQCTVQVDENPLLTMICNSFVKLIEEGYLLLILPVDMEMNEACESDVEVILTDLGNAVYSGNVPLCEVTMIAENLTQLNNSLDISNSFQIIYHLTPLHIEIKISIDLVMLYMETNLTESDVAYINRSIIPMSVLHSLRNGSSSEVGSFS